MASITSSQALNYDRNANLKAFDDTQLGVKGLVDTGLSKVPRVFLNYQDHNRIIIDQETCPIQTRSQFTIPTIDLSGIKTDPVKLNKVVSEIRDACENWGFFQIVNHGIPQEIIDEMLNGVRKFHELDGEVKKQYYTRDYIGRKFAYFSNYFLYKGPVTNWKDTFSVLMAPNPPLPEHLPDVCRDIILEYTKEVKKLGQTLFELISKALGLNSAHLKDLDCDEELLLLGHYYPPCPEPNATIGFCKHADNDVLTILNQDQIGGLQVWHQNEWVDIPHVYGALVINTGDLLQLITNDKIKSVYHRVVAKDVGPRVSLAAFFKPHVTNSRLYGPIKELLSQEHLPIYKEITIKDYLSHYYDRGQDGSYVLEDFKL